MGPRWRRRRPQHRKCSQRLAQTCISEDMPNHKHINPQLTSNPPARAFREAPLQLPHSTRLHGTKPSQRFRVARHHPANISIRRIPPRSRLCWDLSPTGIRRNCSTHMESMPAPPSPLPPPSPEESRYSNTPLPITHCYNRTDTACVTCICTSPAGAAFFCNARFAPVFSAGMGVGSVDGSLGMELRGWCRHLRSIT
jgi:hypothetical protein